MMNKNFTIPMLLSLLLLLSITACKSWKPGTAAGTPGPFDGEKIIVQGLRDRDFTITLGDLKKLPAVTKHGEATRANGETVSVDATGPLLDTFLRQYGKSQKDFSRVRFTAKDRYSIAVPHEILANRQIILSYINDGEPMPEDWYPLHIIIPGERSMYWVRGTVFMGFETGDSRKSVNKVVFLETAAGNLPQEDYRYFDSVDKVIKTRDLITKYVGNDDKAVGSVFLKAGDGLQKNETGANFLSAYIKISGKDAPKFIAPSLPTGMHIRDLLYVVYDQTAIFDCTEAITCLPKQTVENKEGIALSQIFKQIGMPGGNNYRFTGADGRSVELAADNLGNGLVYQNDGGFLTFITSGGSGINKVDNLLSIEVLK
jgi:hypothetical protein